jgi:hypothetical protein
MWHVTVQAYRQLLGMFRLHLLLHQVATIHDCLLLQPERTYRNRIVTFAAKPLNQWLTKAHTFSFVDVE